MSRGRVVALLAILTLVAVARIAATYSVFSLTVDEPYHIAAGLEWLTEDSYRLEPEHPPLARIGFAVDAWLAGARLNPALTPLEQGTPLVYRDAHVVRNVAAARVANLPFFLLAMAVVFLWTRHLAGTATALVAVAFFGALPPVLGHAGVATTDMAATATVAAGLYTFSRWLDEPTWKRTAFFSLALATGMVSKFSFMAYFGVGALALAARRVLGVPRSSSPRNSSKTRAAQLAVAAAVTVLAVIVIYRFDVAAYFGGLRYLARHSTGDHPAYLFGEIRKGGWWYYFPVIFFFKTPIAFLLLAGAGMVLLGRSGRWDLAVTPLAMLAVAMTSRINIGVRHLLPMYPLLAMTAAVAVVAGCKASRPLRMLTVALAGWFFVVTTLAHPDYLSYFNEAAGLHPERIASDSNLDWGQDLYRLAETVEQERLAPIHVAYFGWANPRVHIPHVRPLPLRECVTGWVALSEMERVIRGPGAYDWLDQYQPVSRVGTSIRLYYIPECK